MDFGTSTTGSPDIQDIIVFESTVCVVVWLCVSFVDKAAPLQTSCLLCDTKLCVDPVCVCVYLERKAQ